MAPECLALPALILPKLVVTLFSGNPQLLGWESRNWASNLSCSRSIQLPGLCEGTGLAVTPLQCLSQLPGLAVTPCNACPSSQGCVRVQGWQ